MVKFVKLPRIAITAVVVVVVVVVGVAVLRGNGTINRPNHNAADVMFAQMMIPHHQQAIDMADMALNPSRHASEELRNLASEMKTGQTMEVATLTQLLQQWGEPISMHHHGGMMDGMLSLDEPAALGDIKGPAFDQSWARAMIAHHRGAISMAREVETSGVNQTVRQLARDIVKAQRSEITVLQRTMNSR
jgi:uncharacterized protein (DUF305 family)